MPVYTLPDLTYDCGALEPHISGRIMQLHRDKHHRAYVKGTNETLDKLEEAHRKDDDLASIASLEKSLAFHLSGHVLHYLSNGWVQALRLLRFGFTVAPIVAGLDKFFHLLTNWDKYVAPVVSNTLGIQPHTFMMIVGVIEIVAGIVVAVRPRIGGYVVAAWLLGIIVNLLLVGGYLDVALRDLGLLLAALALARLAETNARIHGTAWA